MYRFAQETIHIDNLHVECIIGIHPHERERPQPLLVSVAIPTEFTRAAAAERIEATLNYSAVADAIREFVIAGRFQLLETLARGLARQLCERFGLAGLHLRVRKPQAVSGSDGAAVSLTVTREDLE